MRSAPIGWAHLRTASRWTSRWRQSATRRRMDVGVKKLSRLISRLRHRQFGILVTTSFLGHQAYQELRSDRHPVVVIAGADIAAILVRDVLLE
jgi:hypothetical protein